MFSRSSLWSRRNIITTGGVAGVVTAAGIRGNASTQSARPSRGGAREIIEQRVESTSIVDTHEHLIEEELRLKGKHRLFKANDWAWIISPVASVNFLKQYLVTAPANKVLTFGGDYIPVEPVLGHVVLARKGIARSLIELVEEGWLDLESALGLAEPIMCGNARALFNLDRKSRRLQDAPWV